MAGLRHTRTIFYSTLAAAALLVGALAYPSMVGAAAGPEPATITATIDSIVPNPAAPGSSSIVTVTFHATGAMVATTVGIDLRGTSGNGTLSLGTNTSGLTNCHLDPTERSITCDWTPAGAEDQTLTGSINVAAAAPDGASWIVGAHWNSREIASDRLGIATTTTTTTTTTTEVTTTTVAGVTTTVAGAAAQPAAKPLSLTG